MMVVMVMVLLWCYYRVPVMPLRLRLVISCHSHPIPRFRGRLCGVCIHPQGRAPPPAEGTRQERTLAIHER